MSDLLDVTVAGSRIRCAAAVRRDIPRSVVSLDMGPGDVLVSSLEGQERFWVWVVRAADRRALAEAIAPGALAQEQPLTEREARNALLSLQRILECDDHGCTLCPDCQARARGEG